MTQITTTTTTSSNCGSSSNKRQRLIDNQEQEQEQEQEQALLPGLPDHIAQVCLSLVHPSILYSVCRSWRHLIYSPSFPPFLSLYTVFLSTSQTSTDQTHLSNTIELFSFDPISSKWQTLPPPPQPFLPPVLRRHPSFLSRNLPIQSLSVSGNLLLLAATTDQFLPALPRPLLFNPLSQKWDLGPQLTTPRRWCAAGATSTGVVYVASGIGSHYNTDVARSVEKWDLRRTNIHEHNHDRRRRDQGRIRSSTCMELGWKWEKLGGLRDGKLSRDAIDAVGWRGKLCMVNVKGYGAKEGAVYDVENDGWEEMPAGMVSGWRGPTAAMDEETLYVVDESKGVLSKYDPHNDRWDQILEDQSLRGADQIAAAAGRVCVICGGGIVVVDVVSSPPRLWELDPPTGFQPVAVHIMPRMSLPTQISNKTY
ncbi:unnamed protein product [Camellia sinensis]